jgi:peptidoglycan hydrolase-like protein with peptidoglycan-binding domain
VFAPRVKIAALATVIGAVLVAGIVFAVTSGPSGAASSAAAAAAPARTAHPASQRPSRPPARLRVLSVSPHDHASHVDGAGPIQVVFSAPLAATSPLPALSPAVPGSWHPASGATMVFTPETGFQPGTRVTLRVPGGASGARSAAGGLMAEPVTAVFRTAGWSTLRLEQLLAQLRYLPLSWAPVRSSVPAGQAGPTAAPLSEAAQLSAVYAPPAGAFTWQAGYPSALTSQWRPGVPSEILTGALMAFQADHGLPMTGTAPPGLWHALFKAVAKGENNPHGYSFALADKASPETLTVWHDGKVVMHGLANTGISVSPTVDGSFPVYLRYRFQVMRGVNPDGSKYSDPVEYVSYFNGGDAVHSYYRPSYGFPQSLGCVELPLSEAQQVWPYLTYGSLVTVVG